MGRGPEAQLGLCCLGCWVPGKRRPGIQKGLHAATALQRHFRTGSSSTKPNILPGCKGRRVYRVQYHKAGQRRIDLELGVDVNSKVITAIVHSFVFLPSMYTYTNTGVTSHTWLRSTQNVTSLN